MTVKTLNYCIAEFHIPCCKILHHLSKCVYLQGVCYVMEFHRVHFLNYIDYMTSNEMKVLDFTLNILTQNTPSCLWKPCTCLYTYTHIHTYKLNKTWGRELSFKLSFEKQSLCCRQGNKIITRMYANIKAWRNCIEGRGTTDIMTWEVRTQIL
jgi:hypothetical protein